MPTGQELLVQHVTRSVESLDRVYLNGYIPALQTGSQLARFFASGAGLPSPPRRFWTA